jgi:hypothetical protein
MTEQDNKKLGTYKRKIENIKTFLKSSKKNIGPSGNERKSNITDPQSAKRSTSHGVIQGYNGVAVVDEKHQIIVNAEAHGEGQEAHLLEPMLESTRQGLKAAKISSDIFEQTKVAADAGYHSGASVTYTQKKGIDAYIADRSHRRRDPAFADYDRSANSSPDVPYRERPFGNRELKLDRDSTQPNWEYRMSCMMSMDSISSEVRNG